MRTPTTRHRVRLLRAALVPLLLGAALALLPAPPASATPMDVFASAAGGGSYEGRLGAGTGVISWKGIPYTTKPGRWQRPATQPAPVTAQGVDAFASTPCAQHNPAGASPPTIGVEDCLTVDIWSKAELTQPHESQERRPVMVFIHGGGFESGAASDGSPLAPGPAYDGTALAQSGVVVVDVQYRLGVFGFLAREAGGGNYGLYDQVQALLWVRDNIHNYGGDGSRVTIFGQSAGGMSVCALVASSETDGLFDAAIVQSGSCTQYRLAATDGTPTAYQPAEQMAQWLRDRLWWAGACAWNQTVSACLQGATKDQLVAAWKQFQGGPSLFTKFSALPVIDGDLITKDPIDAFGDGTAQPVPLMVGTNERELCQQVCLLAPALGQPTYGPADDQLLSVAVSELLSEVYYEVGPQAHQNALDTVLAYYLAQEPGSNAYQRFDRIGTDLLACADRRLARARSGDADTYVYWFGKPAFDDPRIGASHGHEIPYVFGWEPLPAAGGLTTADYDHRLRIRMSGHWLAMAFNGWAGFATNLPGDGRPTLFPWSSYQPVADNVMRLAPTEAHEGGLPQQTGHPRTAACDALWDNPALPFAGAISPPSGYYPFVGA